MPKVNLIVERRRREKRQSAVARGALFSCGGSAALFLLVVIGSGIQIRQQQGRVNEADLELTQLGPKLKQVQALQDQIGVLEPKLQLLQDAKNSTMHWYLIFQQVGQGLPNTSWLDSLVINHDSKETHDTLTMTGQSYSSYTVADTIRQLTRQPMFAQVDLHYVNEGAPTDSNTVHTVKFETQVTLKSQEQKNDKPTG